MTVTRSILAPASQVWSRVSDQSTWLDWYRPLKAFEPVGETTNGIGAVFHEQDALWKTESEVVSLEPGVEIGLSTRSINFPGLLTHYYRRISLEPSEDASTTTVSISGGFNFGLLGWLLFPYTYPQMHAALYLEYRCALQGLASAVEG